MTGLTNPKFDYDQIDKQEAAKLRYYEGELTKSRKRVADEVIKHGEILCGARMVLANHTDGVFCSWLDSVGISRRSAYNAMDSFTAFGGFANLQNIEVSAMYELAKTEDAKKRAMKLADKGVKVTHGMAKAILEDLAERQETKAAKREPTKPAPLIAAAQTAEPEADVFDAEPVKYETPVDRCPNCAAVKWTCDAEGWSCGKCHHPHGEPVGDVDANRVAENRSKAVSRVEALMRDLDDLHHVCCRTASHADAMAAAQEIWKIVKAWK